MRTSAFLAPLPAAVTLAHWAKSTSLVAMVSASILAGVATPMLRADLRTDEEFGAETFVEIAPIVTSAESEAAMDSPESNAEDTPQTSELNEVQSKKTDVDLPTEQTAPTDPEEDLRMAQERTEKESEATPDDVQATEAMAAQAQSASSQASVAAEASEALPDMEQKEATAAPDHGNSMVSQRRIAEWQRKLFGHIAKYKTYPDAARRQRATGETMVAFKIGRDGTLSDVHVVKTSGHDVLDRTAMDVMKRANPLPKLPAELKGETFEFALPMRFTLK